jgi:hypothetical protein
MLGHRIDRPEAADSLRRIVESFRPVYVPSAAGVTALAARAGFGSSNARDGERAWYDMEVLYRMRTSEYATEVTRDDRGSSRTIARFATERAALDFLSSTFRQIAGDEPARLLPEQTRGVAAAEGGYVVTDDHSHLHWFAARADAAFFASRIHSPTDLWGVDNRLY